VQSVMRRSGSHTDPTKLTRHSNHQVLHRTFSGMKFSSDRSRSARVVPVQLHQMIELEVLIIVKICDAAS